MAKKTSELSEESFAFKEITWKIPNFLYVPTSFRCHEESPEFRFGNTTWHLKLYAHDDSTADYYVRLVRSQSSVPEHRFYHKIGLRTRCGEEYYTQSDVHFSPEYRGKTIFCLGGSKVYVQKQLLSSNGMLTVLCQIRVKEEATPETGSRLQQHLNEPSQTEVTESVNQTEVEEASTGVQKLQLDYSELLKSEEDSDVCLKVSDKEFRAHRCILRARSKVFSAMFKHEMEEKASGEVVIEDLDPDSFPDFLQHVYAGRVETLTSKNVSSLYSAADKYDLQELKTECSDYMKRTLSVDTFCDVMTLALLHQEDELLKLAIEFFSKNYTKIIVTVKWQTFLKDHHVTANELLIKALVPAENRESS